MDISIKRTLFPCTSGVYFIEIPLYFRVFCKAEYLQFFPETNFPNFELTAKLLTINLISSIADLVCELPNDLRFRISGN